MASHFRHGIFGPLPPHFRQQVFVADCLTVLQTWSGCADWSHRCIISVSAIARMVQPLMMHLGRSHQSS
jgi:hypothetical protein